MLSVKNDKIMKWPTKGLKHWNLKKSLCMELEALSLQSNYWYTDVSAWNDVILYHETMLTRDLRQPIEEDRLTLEKNSCLDLMFCNRTISFLSIWVFQQNWLLKALIVLSFQLQFTVIEALAEALPTLTRVFKPTETATALEVADT